MTPDSVMSLTGAVESGGVTVTVPLCELSWPSQFVPIFGVTVYFHDPAGTLLSTHDRAVIVPVHADRMVCTTPVLES